MASHERTAHHERRIALTLAAFVLAIGVIVFPAQPTAAGPPGVTPSDVTPLGVTALGTSQQELAAAALALGLCSVEEWQSDITGCVNRLTEVAAQRAQCLKAPTPDAPDAGFAGWFASRPAAGSQSGVAGLYSDYGYAGYSYTTYDIGCSATLMHPDYKFENTVANGEFMIANAVVGASNALRERAWDPGMMWSWADPLVQKATTSIYKKVFTVFGAITLAVVGMYLLWRSRQAEMSSAMTTAGWAVLVMVVVTALATWPVFSAHLADRALVSSLAVVHDAVGPPAADIPADLCTLPDKAACLDHRPPAVRASDTAVESVLYRNWLRGLLGSADSLTAQKYGEALYDARSFSWAEAATMRGDPATREPIMTRKSVQWMKVAEQIRSEDPEAYEYLTGAKGMERIGAGFIALLAAVMFALFDLTASILVLLGFLIFRWAVIAAPVLGTVGILRPASAGFRRLMNAVVAALFNIVIFGTGAAIYLYAVDLIMSTATLPGWLQVVLVWLCGVVGWLLLRPYRRITQLGGKDSAATLAGGTWHRRFFRDLRASAPAGAAQPGGLVEPASGGRPPRTELRGEGLHRADIVQTSTVGLSADTGVGREQPSPPVPSRRMPAPDGGGWSEPEADPAPSYSLYRPRRDAIAAEEPPRLGIRAEARRDG